jgi:hypothetical protein
LAVERRLHSEVFLFRKDIATDGLGVLKRSSNRWRHVDDDRGVFSTVMETCGTVKRVREKGTSGMILSLVLSRSSYKPYNLRTSPATTFLLLRLEARREDCCWNTNTGPC